MEKNYIENCAMVAAGLVISSTKTLVKFANSLRIKTSGVISQVATTADLPSLATSLGRGGAASTNIATGFYRIYTLLGEVNPTTGGITFTWVHGDDISTSTMGRTSDVNQGNSGDEDKAVIGFALVFNASGADFIPNTTELDASGIELQCIDKFGFVGL
jgi:hypothetical protein